MKLGIIGLPNVGKSTLFNALTAARVEAHNYPFCTIEPNIGMVSVPDKRLKSLADLIKPERIIPTTIEFFDIAGLVKGAHKGEGLGNRFLSHIRSVAAIIHVVRCFDDENISHVKGNINPIEDIEIIDLELIFSDLEIIENRLHKLKRVIKGDKSFLREFELLELARDTIEKGEALNSINLTDEELILLRNLDLLSLKPTLYVCNIPEDDLIADTDNDYVQSVKEYAADKNSEIVVISAKIESEISQLDMEERDIFLAELGLNESSLDKLIDASYRLLDLISFFTFIPEEVRAWAIRKGTKAPEAAGKIHTDMERGFIRAEAINYKDLLNSGGSIQAKEKGLIRLEGKEYIVQDGDVILFRFNV